MTRGYAYIRARGDYPKGISDYTEAIRLDHEEAKRRGKQESFFYAYIARADAYRETGQLKKALKDANDGTDINPACHLAYFSRARIYKDLGKMAEATRDFDKKVREI